MCSGDCNETKPKSKSKTASKSSGTRKGVMSVGKPPGWTTKGKSFGRKK